MVNRSFWILVLFLIALPIVFAGQLTTPSSSVYTSGCLGGNCNDASFDHTMVVDGSTADSSGTWIGESNTNSWVCVNLTQKYNITQLIVKETTEGDSSREPLFDINYSNSTNGDNVRVFTDINMQDGAISGVITKTAPTDFAYFTAQHICLSRVRGEGANAARVAEFEIYGFNVTAESTPDTTAPTSSSTSLNNTAPRKNYVVNPSATFTDDTSLSSIWASHNQSGVFTNFSSMNFTGTVLSGNFSPNITITLGRGNVVGFRFTANDTSGNSAQSSIFTLTVADTPVTFTLGINNTSPRINHVVQISSLSNDADTLSTIMASWNCTSSGAWINISNYTNSVTSFNYSVNVSVGRGRGNTCGWLFYANDSVSSFSSSSLSTFVVSNTPPTAPTIIYPTNNLLISDNTIDINITYLADVDGDAISSIRYYINNTLNSTSNANSTFNASDGKYNLSVSVFDGTDWSANATVSSFKIDVTNPTDDLLTIILFGTFFKNENYTRTVTASDTNLYGHNLSVYSSTGSLIVSQETTGISTVTNAFVVHINSTYGEGNYTIYSNESDDHTAEKIKEYGVVKDEQASKLDFDTGDDTISVRLLSSSIDLNNYSTQKQIDRYTFDYVFKSSNKENTYTFLLTHDNTSNIIYREKSKYPAHFIIGDNWVDFALDTGFPVSYNVVQTTNGYFVVITTQETTLRFKSIGGINKASSTSSFIIDTITPSSSAYRNASTSGNSITTATNVNISLTVQDLYLNNVTINHNASGSFSEHFFSSNGNTTYSYIIGSGNLTTAGRIVGWNATAYDIAGNMLETNMFTFEVSAPPGASPAPVGGGGGTGGGSFTRCDALAQANSACYWYNQRVGACAKGCPEKYTCNKEQLRCEEGVVVQSIPPTNNEPLNIKNPFSAFWLRFKSLVGSFFDTSPTLTESKPLSLKTSASTDSAASVQSDPNATPMEKTQVYVAQNPIMALVFVGVIGTILALLAFQWAIIAPPQVYFVVGYWLIVALFWKFNIFGG